MEIHLPQNLRDLPGEVASVDACLIQDLDAFSILLLVDGPTLLHRIKSIGFGEPCLVSRIIDPQRRSMTIIRTWQSVEVRLPEGLASVQVLQRKVQISNRLDPQFLPMLLEDGILVVCQGVQV